MKLSNEYYKKNLENIIFRIINTVIVIAVIGTILFWVAKAKFNTIEISIPHDILNQTTISNIDNNTGTYSINISDNGDTTLQFDYVAYYKYKNDIRKTIDNYIKETLKDENIRQYIKDIKITNDYKQADICIDNTKQDDKLTLICAKLSVALSYELQFYDTIEMKDSNIVIKILNLDNYEITSLNENDIKDLALSLKSVEKENNIEKEEIITRDSIDKKIKLGKKAKLSTIKVKIDDIQLTDTLRQEGLEDKQAQEGTTFLVVTLNIENITKSPIEASLGDMILIDNKDRTFTVDTDNTAIYSDYDYYMTLQPNKKHKAQIIYNIPNNTKYYALLKRHEDNNKIYGLLLE